MIEDAEQSFGSTLNGRHAGTFGDAGCYSLYPSKVATSSEGGFVATDDEDIRGRLLMVRTMGCAEPQRGNSRPEPEDARDRATMAAVQMRKLPEFHSLRRRNAEILSDLLEASNVKVPQETDD